MAINFISEHGYFSKPRYPSALSSAGLISARLCGPNWAKSAACLQVTKASYNQEKTKGNQASWAPEEAYH